MVAAPAAVLCCLAERAEVFPSRPARRVKPAVCSNVASALWSVTADGAMLSPRVTAWLVSFWRQRMGGQLTFGHVWTMFLKEVNMKWTIDDVRHCSVPHTVFLQNVRGCLGHKSHKSYFFFPFCWLAALQALKRKKRYEKQLAQIDGTLSTIEFQREALENANTNTEVLKNMGLAAKAMKAAHDNM